MRANALPNPISCTAVLSIMWNTILDEKGRGGWEEKTRTDQEALCGDGVCCESSMDSDDRSNLDFVDDRDIMRCNMPVDLSISIKALYN